MGHQESKVAATLNAEVGSMQQPNLMQQPTIMQVVEDTPDNMTSSKTMFRMVNGEKPVTVTVENMDAIPAYTNEKPPSIPTFWMENTEVKIICQLANQRGYLHGTSGTIQDYNEKKDTYLVKCHERHEEGHYDTFWLPKKGFSTYTKGDKVVLKNMGDLNGKKGTLVEWNATTDQWAVKLDVFPDGMKPMMLCTRNVTKLPEIKKGSIVIYRGFGIGNPARWLDGLYGIVVGKLGGVDCWQVEDLQKTGMNLNMIVKYTKDGKLIAEPENQDNFRDHPCLRNPFA